MLSKNAEIQALFNKVVGKRMPALMSRKVYAKDQNQAVIDMFLHTSCNINVFHKTLQYAMIAPSHKQATARLKDFAKNGQFGNGLEQYFLALKMLFLMGLYAQDNENDRIAWKDTLARQVESLQSFINQNHGNKFEIPNLDVEATLKEQVKPKEMKCDYSYDNGSKVPVEWTRGAR